MLIWIWCETCRKLIDHFDRAVLFFCLFHETDREKKMSSVVYRRRPRNVFLFLLTDVCLDLAEFLMLDGVYAGCIKLHGDNLLWALQHSYLFWWLTHFQGCKYKNVRKNLVLNRSQLSICSPTVMIVFVTKEALWHTACCPSSLCLVIMLTRCLCLAWTPLCGKPNNRNVGVLTCVTWLQCWLYRYIACVWCCITRDSALLVLQWCWHITFTAFVSCLPYKEIGAVGVCVKAIIVCSTYSTFWDDARCEDSLGEKSSLRLQHG